MPEVASATITVTPVLEGAQQSLTEQMTQAATPAGTAAGTAAGKSMGQSLGKGMTSAGGMLTKTVTVPLMAAGTAAVMAWKEVDAGLDTIVQKTGASGAELDGMHQILSNIATSIPTDFQTAGEAIGEVNTRFGLTGQSLEDLSGQFVKFAQLNGQDVSRSVDSVSGMMAAFGMNASEAGRMLDALNVVGQQTGVDVGTLSDTVQANAAQFQQMGLSAENAASLLGQMSMTGLDSSSAMMGLKTAMKNATEEGIPLTEALSNFEGVMNSNASESDKLAAAYEMFGSRAGAAIYNAVANGELNLSDFTGSLGEFEGSVSSTFEGTLDPMDKFQTTLNQLKDLGAQIVEAAGPAISGVLDTLSQGVETLSNAWNGLSPEMQDFIIKAASIAVVLGPILMIGGKLIGGISSLTGGLGGLIGKIGGLGGAASTAAGPVASAGGSFATMAGGALQIIAVAGGFLMVAFGIKMIADAAVEVSSAGGPAIATFFGMIAAIGGLMAVAAALGPVLTAGAVGIGVFGAAMVGIGAGVALATYGVSLIIDAIGRLVETISSNADGINSVVSNVGETFSGVVTTISDGVATVVDAVGGAISGVLDSIAGIIDSIGNAALNAGTGFDMLANAVIRLVNDTGVIDLGTTLAAVANGVKDINKAAGDSSDSATKVKTLSDSFVTLKPSVNNAKTAMEQFGTAGKTAINGVASAIASANIAGSMSSAIAGAINAASSGIATLRSMFANTSFNFNQHIAMPHFSMSGSFDAKTKRVPTVSVSWYARAAEYGALFDRPTIIGVGDSSQPELLIGEQKLQEMLGGRGNVWNVTVNGAENPEQWARRFVREAKMYARIS